MKKIFVSFGTRPEAIKMCPLIREMKKHKNLKCVVCLTGQHREMLKQVMDAFEIKENYNLQIMRPKQSLFSITVDVLSKIEEVLEMETPDIVLVHGDTTTAMAVALAAFYKRIPVGHVEAGLRTHNIYSPYPEEMNRLLIDRLASYYFAPTNNNRMNLIKEGIVDNIFVTGNTVLDSFEYTIKDNYNFENADLHGIDYDKKVIIVTAHRRENWGEPLVQICRAIRYLAEKYKEITFVYAVHSNPIVHETVHNILKCVENVILTPPLNVIDMHNLVSRCCLILTDSGGLQEEAPSLGKPVLVLRNETERLEAVSAGTAKVIGTRYEDIIFETETLINNKNVYQSMANAVNPYGDGNACKRIINIIEDIN